MFHRFKSLLRFRAVQRVYTSHERILVPLMLLVGVVIDVVTFRSINLTTAFMLLGGYAFVAGAMILFMHAHDTRRELLERPTPKIIFASSPP